MRDEQQRFDEVLDALERERQRIDEDLKRLTVAAAYLPAAAAPTTRETPVLGPQETYRVRTWDRKPTDRPP
jgi:hypothetical protein